MSRAAPSAYGSATSEAAARSIAQHMPELRLRVWCAVELAGWAGITAEELESACEMPGNTVRPRLVELREDGLVMDSGRTRRTESGRSATIYVTREAAKEHAPHLIRIGSNAATSEGRAPSPPAPALNQPNATGDGQNGALTPGEQVDFGAFVASLQGDE